MQEICFFSPCFVFANNFANTEMGWSSIAVQPKNFTGEIL